MSGTEVSCAELVEAVTDYVEGVLAAPDAARLEAHLGDCPGCRTYLEQIRQTIKMLGHLPAAELAREEIEPLLDVFRRWKREDA